MVAAATCFFGFNFFSSQTIAGADHVLWSGLTDHSYQIFTACGYKYCIRNVINILFFDLCRIVLKI